MTHHERRIQTHADLDRLNADELEAVHYLVLKLIAGSKKHGPLQLASDRRDWPSEMLEEYADALFYAAFASVQRQRRTQPPVADLAGLAARESAPVAYADMTPAERADREATYWARVATICANAPGVEPISATDDAYYLRHPLGSPERVQAVEEHRAACDAGVKP